jgi:hypothetical protein
VNLKEMLKQLNAECLQSEEAAKSLAKSVGVPVNSGHIRRLVKSGKLTAENVAGRLYVHRKSLKALVASGWKPGDKPGGDRTMVCYNVWLTRATVDAELTAIKKALGREVRAAPRKYYHKKKES